MEIGFKVPPHWVDWRTLEDIWQVGGQLDVFTSAWTMDHLDLGDGPCWEGWTSLALLSRHVPGKTVGHLVLANPFRHPVVLAKMATVMDHATAGRFVLGFGAGSWPPELESFGLSRAPIQERVADMESGLRVLRALFGRDGSPPAAAIDLDAPPYRLTGAHNDPPPLTPGGPPIWLGAQGEKVGLRLVAQYADGWNFSSEGGLDGFRRKRQALLNHCDVLGRDPTEIAISAQIIVGDDLGATLGLALEHLEIGVDHLMLFIDPRRGAAGLEQVAKQVAEPLRASHGDSAAAAHDVLGSPVS